MVNWAVKKKKDMMGTKEDSVLDLIEILWSRCFCLRSQHIRLGCHIAITNYLNHDNITCVDCPHNYIFVYANETSVYPPYTLISTQMLCVLLIQLSVRSFMTCYGLTPARYGRTLTLVSKLLV